MPDRKFHSVSKTEQSKLENSFPCLNNWNSRENYGNFKQSSVSVFDHWLTIDESVVFDANNSDKHSEFDSRLYKFATMLSKSNESLLVKFKGRYKKRPSFKKFSNEQSRMAILQPRPHDLGNQQRFILAFPSLGLIYAEGWDFTHQIYYNSESTLGVVSDIAGKSGLYVL
jgi:hypothetical protein